MANRENTQRLADVADLSQEDRKLRHSLDRNQRRLGASSARKRQADTAEQQRLLAICQDQAAQIEDLKYEVSMLSRKGEHVPPPGPGASLRQSGRDTERLPPLDTRS